jgi:tetratricopeptide (TPR) repeat protein
LKEAMEADPGFAAAHGLLANAMVTLGYWGFLPPPVAFPQAKEAALRAVAIDAGLSEAHVALAWVRWLVDWDLPACEREIERALELNPSAEANHLLHGLYQATIARSRERAEEAAWLALEIDPLSVNTNFSAAWILMFARAYEEAVGQANRAIELHPDSPLTYQALGWAYVGQERFGDGAAAFEKGVSLAPDAHSAAGLAHAFARAGDRARAIRLLDEMTARSRREDVPDVVFAVIAAGLGDRDGAFAWLERCYAARDPHLFWLAVMPAFEPLREDPRYHDLLGRMGLPPPVSSSQSGCSR